MASVKRVLVVGGGSAGMALSMALQRSGVGTANVEVNPTWSIMRLDAAHMCTPHMAIWEKSPNTPGAGQVGVLARANAALAAPMVPNDE